MKRAPKRPQRSFPGWVGVVVLLALAPGAVAQTASSTRVIFLQAEEALKAGDYGQAEAGFQKVLRADPHSAAAYTNLGVTYLRTGRLDEAIQVLERAHQLAPGIVGIDMNLGLAYYRKRDFPRALPHFIRVLKSQPSSLQGRYLAGMCRFMMDDYASAVKDLEPIWDQERGDLDYLFVLGICYGKIRRDQDSQETFQELVEVGGHTPHLHLLLGKAYLDLYDDAKSETELKAALAGDPSLPFAHYELGVLYRRMGKFDLAAQCFDREIQISPNEPWSYQNRAEIWLDEGHPDEAIPLFKRAYRLDPRLADSPAGIGKAYLRKSQPQEAVEYLKKALALESDNATFHNLLGQALLKLGNRENARKQFDEASRLEAESGKRKPGRTTVKSPTSTPLPEPQNL